MQSQLWEVVDVDLFIMWNRITILSLKI